MSVRDREEDVVARLRGMGPSLGEAPDPGFRAATRARVVAMAAVRTPEPAPRSTLQRLLSVRAVDAAPVRWRSRLTAGVAGAALTVTALAALVTVSGGARPGDVLYELKRGTEQTQLALAGDSRGQTLLGFASTRLDELEALVGDGGTALPPSPAGRPGAEMVAAAGADPALVLETLRTMDDQTQEGAALLAEHAVETEDSGPLDRLARWAGAQSGELTALAPGIPAEAAQAVTSSLDLLGQVAVRTTELEAALSCQSGPAVTGRDELGPVATTCPGPVPDPEAPIAGQPSGPAPAPQGSTPGQPTEPTPVPAPVPAPQGGGTGGLPTPTVPAPTTPGVPVPSLPTPKPNPDPPPLAPPAPSSAVVPVPPLDVCLPLLLPAGC